MSSLQSMNQFNTDLSDADFAKLSKFIESNYGIKMPYIKKGMLQARLRKRLIANNMATYREYCKYIFTDENSASEIIHMMDAVSTNKTDFFREPLHFDFLKEVVLPSFQSKNTRENLKIWSAASSSGEEIYTIAMVISEFLENRNTFDYSILGTDISVEMLQEASTGIYLEKDIIPIPLNLKKKYLLRNKNKEKKNVRIIPELRSKTAFQRLNLIDEQYPVANDFDIIFCRNVLIYFDRTNQENVVRKLCAHLKPGGYLFLGHSESITGMNLPLEQLKPAVFRKI